MTTTVSTEQHEPQAEQPLDHFHVASYLETRAAKDDFIMVEFGHDARPVAYKQPRSFVNNRAYIGFEAWLRDPRGEKQATVRYLHERYNGDSQNIHYHTLALGGIVRTNYDYGVEERWFDGEYNPTTPLPDATVDEVFIGNVFGDPHVGESELRTQVLLQEALRIVSDTGVVIIRETLTPFRTAKHLEPIVDEQATILSRITPRDDTWDELEDAFSNERAHTLGSYYLFIARQSKSD